MSRKIRIIRNRPRNAARPVRLSVILEGHVQRRFWSKVQKGSPNECWPWRGAQTDQGYGIVNITLSPHNYKKIRAHVFALMSHTKQENKQDALHSLKCTTKLCVNPHHLRWGTRSENAFDARELGKIPGQLLTWEEVDEIRSLLATYTGVEIAAFFGLDQTTVSNIKRQKSWKPETRRNAA